ncbi:MAG: hypothetical protein DMH00_13130 [Acidobacteria bacterium]|nr:MAG: hypothetical protein DMH00_13130 [Acidobacteriota bacterium]
MNDDWSDPEQDLRARFKALRLSDTALAGSFETSWRAARLRLDARRPAGLLRRRTFLAAAGVTAVVAAAAIEEAIAQARELQNWSAPTDSLLTTTDLSISGTVPASAPGSRDPLEPSAGASSPHLR